MQTSQHSPALILRSGMAQSNPLTIMQPSPPLTPFDLRDSPRCASFSFDAPAFFAPSNFEYLLPGNQTYVKDAYDVISRNEWWRPFREALLSRGVDQTTGFTYTDDPFYSKIKKAICSTYIGSGHSGTSMGFVMREMEFIALHGEPAYRVRNQRAAAE